MNKELKIFEGGFPLDGDTLLFMQSQSKNLEKMAKLFGENYIISGVERNGANVTDGVIVIGGEILPFLGGAWSNNGKIVTQTESVAYLVDNDADGTGDLKAAELTRYACAEGFASPTDPSYEITVDANLFDLSALKRGTDLWAYNLFDVFFSNTPLPYTGALADIHPWFKLCDGQDGTPNLLGKFLVGNDPNDTDFETIGNQGGAKEVALTVNQMPAHNHSGNTNSSGSHRHTFTRENPAGGGAPAGSENGNSSLYTDVTSYAGSHSHTFTTNSKGNGQAHENLPPYFTVAYIIFKGE